MGDLAQVCKRRIGGVQEIGTERECDYLGTGRFGEAEQMLRKALRLDPENELLQKNLEAVIKKQEESKLH